MNRLYAGSELAGLISKVEREERLGLEDGLRLFKSKDLLAIGYMADLVRRRKNRDRVFFISSSRANHTKSESAHNLSLEQAVLKTEVPGSNDSEIHIATIPYGTVESRAGMIEQLISLRVLQDKTGSFVAFDPFAFHSKNTGPEVPTENRQTTGFDDIKALAIARVILDNFDHIMASWRHIGLKLAQVSLSFGVDYLAGPVTEGQITGAEAQTGQVLTVGQLTKLIKAAGRIPVEQDSRYNITVSIS